GNPAVTQFLDNHAEGVADIAFRVRNLEALVARVKQAGGQIQEAIHTRENETGRVRWCRIAGWGSLSHTLIEYSHTQSRPPSIQLEPKAETANVSESSAKLSPERFLDSLEQPDSQGLPWLSIDHAVLNVPLGQLEAAATWSEEQLGFVRRQQFAIATAQSGLRSFVLKHPEGDATLPINEPTSRNSQIQEFLEFHQGAGIQHVALETRNLVQTVATLRQRGVPFLSVPPTYYQQVSERPGFWHRAGDWDAIAQQQILVDWPADEPQTRLLQTFTQPVFERPTFFWELIERQAKSTRTGLKRVEGFGEGNFQALFEAIEREQQQRGSL
ncbi:MAG: VOC family protein, partial [Cyanobacteria bacterium P01_H01_bin.121]